jgi:hypothetical protein
MSATGQETGAHTPGPWCVEAVFGKRLHDICTAKEIPGAGIPTLLASVYYDDEKPIHISTREAEANARLMAAAPEMLALLKQYASECATCGGCGECDLPVDGSEDELESVACIDCADIRVVIAKAEGRS